jgi:AcrR family transcriptional regulator
MNCPAARCGAVHCLYQFSGGSSSSVRVEKTKNLTKAKQCGNASERSISTPVPATDSMMKRREKKQTVEITTQIKNPKLVERRRDQLIAAATKSFIEKGYDKTSVRDIVRESGLSMGNLYDYISSKEDILYLVHQHMIHTIYRSLFDLKEDEFEIGYVNIVDLIEHALREALNFQDQIILLYQESGALSTNLLKSILTQELEYIYMFKRLLDKANEKGVANVEDTEFVANLIVYLISFLSLRRWSLRGREKEKMISLLMTSIKRILGCPTNQPDKRRVKKGSGDRNV